jgi:hypothetical protein
VSRFVPLADFVVLRQQVILALGIKKPNVRRLGGLVKTGKFVIVPQHACAPATERYLEQ